MPTTVDEIRSTTSIDAPIERVWRAITTPAELKQWFFGVDTEADWRRGSVDGQDQSVAARDAAGHRHARCRIVDAR